ncbi:cytochrome o ubiquinol oxidase subunit II, partial [mine drainage metagenome]
WCHSTKVELTMWGIPVVIVCVLAVIAWRSSHQLNPFRHIASPVKPVHIEAVAMDWKWLFIYPNHNVASVGEVAIPVGV